MSSSESRQVRAVIRPAACICCNATVTRFAPCDPVPIPEVTSPNVFMIGITSLARKVTITGRPTGMVSSFAVVNSRDTSASR